MGKASRDKGKRGEREVAAILRDAGYDCRRGVQYHGGADSPDVVGLPGVHIEVKRVEAFKLYDALSQAKGDCGDKKPVVIHRRNNCEWVVVQPLKDWLELYREWEVANEQQEQEETSRGIVK
jgi:Holliday junction resolvase